MIRIVTMLVLAMMSACTFAQTTKPVEDDSGAIILRTYNLADMVRATQDYPLTENNVPDMGGGGGGGGQGLYGGGGGMMNPGLAPAGPGAAPPGELRSSVVDVNSIVQLLESTIDAQSWASNGGAVGRISSLGNLLVIAQTKDVHAQIESLLTQLRKDIGPSSMVCIRAYWVTLNAEEAARVLGKGQPAPTTAPEVPDDLVDKSRIYCQLQTLCFSGQTVHVSSGREHTVIEDVSPIVGQGAVAMDPMPRLVMAGVQLQVRPQLVPNADVAVVDIASIVTESDATTSVEPRAAATQTALSSVDRQNRIKQDLQTTARLPLGKKILVGGMTIEPAKLNGQQVYLVMELSALPPK